MDAVSVSYYNQTKDQYGMGNDFLTELRLYMYLRFFAGVGFDYSVVAAKLGVYGQINMDMRFRWLNRPYMGGGTIKNVADGRSDGNLNGQLFVINGQTGLELYFKLLIISYEKILYSHNFTMLNEKTGRWDTIDDSWKLNTEANRKASSELLKSGSMSAYSVGGQQVLALNLAPTLEDRTYLRNGGRSWGGWLGPGDSLRQRDSLYQGRGAGYGSEDRAGRTYRVG